MPDSKIKYCPNCGQRVKASAQFCPNCGYRFTRSVQRSSNAAEAHSSKQIVDNILSELDSDADRLNRMNYYGNRSSGSSTNEKASAATNDSDLDRDVKSAELAYQRENSYLADRLGNNSSEFGQSNHRHLDNSNGGELKSKSKSSEVPKAKKNHKPRSGHHRSKSKKARKFTRHHNGMNLFLVSAVILIILLFFGYSSYRHNHTAQSMTYPNDRTELQKARTEKGVIMHNLHKREPDVKVDRALTKKNGTLVINTNLGPSSKGRIRHVWQRMYDDNDNAYAVSVNLDNRNGHTLSQAYSNIPGVYAYGNGPRIK